MDERERLTKRYLHQMEQRKGWLEEEREKLDSVEDRMREMKSLAAPYIAVGDRLVVEIVERLERDAKALREAKLKGIAQPDPAEQTTDWLRSSVSELWEEKLAFGYRRPTWDALIDVATSELERVQNLPPPKKKGAAGTAKQPAAAVPASDDLDLDLDL